MVCPFSKWPWVKIPSNAVWEATGTDAASSKERLDGFLAMAAALTARYSAYAPMPVVVPNTASPAAHAATSLPICSTTPRKTHDQVSTADRSGVSVLLFRRPQQDP